jgi:hypothetical protein
MKVRVAALAAVILALLAVPGLRAEDTKPDEEGFLRSWLLLAPIPMADGQSEEDALNKEWIANEAKLAPKADDKLKVGEKELTWKAITASDYFFDINGAVGDTTENAVAYAVAYVTAPEEMKGVQLRVGSDDMCKVYLNGKEVIKATEDRPVDKDQNQADDVTLNKGVNVIVFKIVNGAVDWAGAARFTDKDGKPVTGVTLGLTPPAGK